MQIMRNLHYSVGGQMHKRSILIPGKKSYKVVDIETGLVSRKKDIKNKIQDIMLEENGKTYLLHRIEDKNITFFLTSKCNHHCIMCPQQLNIDNEDNDLLVKRVIDNLDYSVIEGICFTGGEPLLKIHFIEQVLEESPDNILITILSNGSILPSKKILDSERCKICIPLYAPYDTLHNYLSGSNSFYKIVNNLMFMSHRKISIELRFVLTKQNINVLEEYARFIWRNLPFVSDIAFMGIELTADALKNKDELWINPKEYVPTLERVIQFLDNCGLTVWIYNLPYCLFDSTFHKFLVQSISKWKIRYLSICEGCKLKQICGGMFYSDTEEFEKIIQEKIHEDF